MYFVNFQIAHELFNEEIQNEMNKKSENNRIFCNKCETAPICSSANLKPRTRPSRGDEIADILVSMKICRSRDKKVLYLC